MRIGVTPFAENNQGVSVRAGNEMRILINVPTEFTDIKYKITPDNSNTKKIKIVSVDAQAVTSGEESLITTQIQSMTDLKLSQVYADIKVINKEQQVTTLQTQKIELDPQKEKSLTAVFDTDGQTEDLQLQIEVFYQGGSVSEEGLLHILQKNAENSFEVGRSDTSNIPFIAIIALIVFAIILVLFFLLKRRGDTHGEQ